MKIFISYSHKDRRLCEECECHLKALSRVEKIEAWRDNQILAGDDWRQDIRDAIRNADVVILLISVGFMASDFIWKKELPHALARHKSGECLVVPVIIKSVEGWKDIVGGLNALPAEGKPIDNFRKRDPAWTTVMQELRRLGRERRLFLHADDLTETPVAYDPARRAFQVPRPENPFFTGRSDDLDWVARALRHNNQNAARPVALLHGTGGVGKSEAAAQYAHQNRDAYKVVWWIDAETAAGRDAGFGALARALGLPGYDPRDIAATRAAVLGWMTQTPGWLAIYDNADAPDDLKPWLPQRAAGHALITSRNPAWRAVADVRGVEALSLTDAAKFLRDRSGDDNLAASEALAAALGGLPLACEHAAAYVEDAGCGLAGYLPLLRGDRFAAVAEPVVKTFTLAMTRAEKETPLAGAIMNILAHIAPEPLPRAALLQGSLGGEHSGGKVDEHALNLALKALRRRGLVTGGDPLSVHRLVQAAARTRQAEPKTWAQAALKLLAKAFPDDSYDARTWSECAALRPHADALLAAIPDADAAAETVDLLCNHLSGYLWARGDYGAALPLGQRCLSLCEARFGPTHDKTAAALSNLGNLLQVMERPIEAEVHTRRALKINEDNLGPDALIVALRLSNLGAILHSQQRFAEAEALLRRALDIEEKAPTPDVVKIASHLCSLGPVLNDLGRAGEAEPLLLRALGIFKAHYGPDHPEVATCLNNLADSLCRQGDAAGAADLFRQSLAIREKWLGPDHPDTQISRRNLAAAEAQLAQS